MFQENYPLFQQAIPPDPGGRVMSLLDVTIRNAKPKSKPYKLVDAGGLHVVVTPAGGKLWRWKYRYNKKERLAALGKYPSVSLAEARAKHEMLRNYLASGGDPADKLREEKEAQQGIAQNTFERVAREWHQKNTDTWTEQYAGQIMRRLEADIFPSIGDAPISELKPIHMLAALQKIEGRGARESAHRIKQTCGQIMRYAVATGRAERDIVADLRGSLAPVKKGHHASLTDPADVAGLMSAIDGYDGSYVVRCALRLLPLVFVRPGELQKMEWAEVDLERKQWCIPSEKMKMRQPHVVPLSAQALTVLEEIKPLTGSGKYVFPCQRSNERPMSNMALLAALRRIGYTKEQMTPHGFRAMARTLLDEVLQIRPDFIEHQLAHAVRDPNGRAYNRTAHLVERRRMMQRWADYLDELKSEQI
jgi:integrase